MGSIGTVTSHLYLLFRCNLKGLDHSSIVWLIPKSKLAVCPVMCILVTAHDCMLSSWALDHDGFGSRYFCSLSSALRQVIDEIGFLSAVNAFSFDLVLSYVTYYRSDEMF